MILEYFKGLIKDTTEEEFGFPCIAKIVAVDREKYICDCKELDNDGKEMRNTFMDVAIPKLVGSKDGGIFLTPTKGTIVLLNFLNGDRNYPIISAIMGGKNTTNSQENKLVIVANGKDLGEILIKMCEKIISLQTVGSPSTQTLRQDQQLEWKNFVEQEIKGLFYQGNSGSVGGNGDTGTDSKPEPDTDEGTDTEPTAEEYMYFENPKKLYELNDLARTRIVGIADKVKKYMDSKGEKFVKIYITSAHRTLESQVKILSKMMRGKSGNTNMYKYYYENIDNKQSKSLHYLNGLQAYFNYENGKPSSLLESERWHQILEDHRKEIERMGREFDNEKQILVTNNDGSIEYKTKRTIEAERLLTEYMKPREHNDWAFFRPSRHMMKIETVDVIDISILGERDKTAINMLKKNGSGYKPKEGEGEPHIHLNLY